jgi:pyrrolidone-carboxylate peptidase
MKLLLTGFGSFKKKNKPEVRENISEKIIREILKNKKRKDRARTSGIIMPVEWQAAEKILERHFFNFSPDIVISMGHASGYKALTLEKKYFNIAKGLDNKKSKHKSGIIKSNGNDFYLTNIDVSKTKRHLERKNIPTKIHGGKMGMKYLCNFAGYLSAYHSKTLNQKTKYIFIHIPAPEDIPYNISLRGVKEIINFLIISQKATMAGQF